MLVAFDYTKSMHDSIALYYAKYLLLYDLKDKKEINRIKFDGHIGEFLLSEDSKFIYLFHNDSSKTSDVSHHMTKLELKTLAGVRSSVDLKNFVYSCCYA